MNASAIKHEGSRADQELLAQIAAGKLDALGELFERHEPTLRRYLARLGVSASDVDDLVQATFLELMRAAGRFDPSYSARAFLLGIASIMVRRQRRSLARLAARLAAFADRPEQEAQVARDPGQIVASEAALRDVARAIEKLPSKKREVFVLITLEGLSGEEVARALGIPVKTVWTRLHHARRALRACLPEREP